MMTSNVIRIVNIDWYMCIPMQGLDTSYSEFRGTVINQVPVLRLFGSTSLGKKICVHIHGVFPYFYMPYDGSQEVSSLKYQIATNIDKAVNISLNQSSSNTQHVYKISLVSGIPMYGYHNKKHQFLKVYLYNPILIRKVSNLLMNESTLGKLYQPHETHLSFPLQFMIDYNLHGMSNLVLSEMKYRIDPAGRNPDIDPDLFLPATVNKSTVCELEADALAEHIINRQEISSGNIAVNPGIAALWEDERQRRRNKGESSQIEHLLEMKRINIKPTKSHNLYKQALLERLAILNTDKPTEEKLNLSVYPAESPDDIIIQNASLVDSHISSIDVSLDDINLTSSSTLDDTLLCTEPNNLSITMDAEAQKLLDILKHLGENVNYDIEDDSILTQVVKDDDDEDRYFDLSMPLEAVTTPTKILPSTDHGSESDDDLNKTVIPQLDGEWDSVEEEGVLEYPALAQSNSKTIINIGKRLLKKALYVRLINMDVQRGRNMPLLDLDDQIEETNFNSFANKEKVMQSKTPNPPILEKCNENSLDQLEIAKPKEDVYIKIRSRNILNSNQVPRKRFRKPPYVKLQEDIKRLGNFVKRMRRQDQLIRIMRKFHARDHHICVLLSKKGKPKFNVISKDKMLARYTGRKNSALSKIPVINDILYKTANYIDPNLNLTLRSPSNSYLYAYNQNMYADIIDIPKKLTKPGKKRVLNKFIKENIKYSRERSNKKYLYWRNYDSDESSIINLEEETLPTVLFEDLPEFLKRSIRNINSGHIGNSSIGGNNECHTLIIEESYADTDTPRNSEEMCNKGGDSFDLNDDLKAKAIDADNKENIYIFSSKYLTNIDDNKLDDSLKNQSNTQLKESVENIRQQLQKHLEFLKISPGARKSNLNNEERCRIFNNVLDNNNNSDTPKSGNKENAIKTSQLERNYTGYDNMECNKIFNSVVDIKEYIPNFDKNAVERYLSLSKNNIESKSKVMNARQIHKKSASNQKIIPRTYKTVMYNSVIINLESETQRNKAHEASKKPTINNETFKRINNSDISVYRQKVTAEKRRSLRINSPKYQKINPKRVDVQSLPYSSDTDSNYSTESDVICWSCDGTMDSSSSSEDEGTRRPRRVSKRLARSNYSALPISISPPRSRSQQRVDAGKDLTSLKTNKNSEEKETRINLNPPNKTVCDINVKRRLSFSNNSSLHTTLIEEKVICTYSPNHRKEHIIDTSNSQDGDKSLQHIDKQLLASINSSENNLDKTGYKNYVKILSNKSVNNDLLQQNSIDNFVHTSDSEEEINRSFFKSPEIVSEINLLLTASEKYDKVTKYNVKQGTSKVLTPNEVCTDNLKSSGESSESSNFGLLTPYQRVVDKIGTSKEYSENMDGLEISSDHFCSGNSGNKNLSQIKLKVPVLNLPSSSGIPLNSKYVLTVPLKSAPSKEEVCKSLDKYKIPYVSAEVPFYSNVEDVTGSVEIGYNVLKISSKTSAHLPEFDSQTDSINKFRKLKLDTISSNLEWRKSNIKSITLGFCKDRSCIITPAKKPPTVSMIKSWIREKSKKVTTPVKKVDKVKIFVPLSPGNQNDDDSMDISLTLSPCTPRSSPCSQNFSQNTRSSSRKIIESNSESSVSECDGIQHEKGVNNKLSQPSTPSLRKTLLLSQNKTVNQSFQITGVTVNNTYGFDTSIENLQEAKALVKHEHLTLLVIELHTCTRGDFKPDPEYDSIRAIFYSVFNDVPESHEKPANSKGIIAVNCLPLSPSTNTHAILDGAGIDCNIDYVNSEENLINEFLKLLKYWDPDIVAGYEIEMLSWGYLIERAYILGINLKPLLARATEGNSRWKEDDGQNELKITGRIVLDVWRLMRHEIALQSYTFESIVYHILHKRVPQYPFRDLSFWWDHRSGLYRHRTAKYYLFRVVIILELFDKLDLIGRTSELARLFGIQFYEVLSRGSQFRVESMMLRLAKPLNFIPVSPSVEQRANMKAPEYIALILEPESKLYNDPVIVLDFQSLYPSIIIAYNYCFTTCIGRVERLGKNMPFEFGATQLKISRKRLEKLVKKDLLNFSPCGAGFVKREVRDGILPRMLREILDTRLMVKNSMKENRDNKILQKVLHNRQLGLKLIANVTYGYTAANFSGRMPSVEVGDSVVSKGRETLQRAIEMVETTPEWGARVVYGDTDSLFVLVPGKSREHAFKVGKEIADAVTKANPDPIKLKLEKIYQPCILQTKKRYVGYMYESPDQKEPVYNAKGIETVRRDGCPAVSKMLEKCLKILFETKDVSIVKKYVLRQFNKIIACRASIQDLTFAKEYRGASGYRPGACVPALELAKKWKTVDKRSEPRSGQRVPYIIVSGPPGLPLIRLVRSPTDLLNDSSLRPNALYYITKVIIPPINRCFNLIGADLNLWFNQMPRKQLQYLPSSVSPEKKSTISQYFSTTSCASCGEQTQTGICDKCNENPQITTITLMEKIRGWEEKCFTCNLICQSCTSSQTEIKCVSLDCPVLYQRIQTNRDVQQATYVRQLLSSSDFLF